MEKMSIRWATYEDAEKLAIVHSEGWKTAYKNIIPDEVLDSIRVDKRRKIFERALAGKSEETCILVVENKTIGFLTLGSSRDDDWMNHMGRL